jgi:hypothetical protein
MTDERFHRLLAQQLEMNPRTWAALLDKGIDEQTLLVIEFSFTAPGKQAARNLVKILRARTNFVTEIIADGSLLKRHWRIVGYTQPSTASIEMLDDWVTFMVTLGAKNGDCRFDGWGVKLPERPPHAQPSQSLTQGFSTNGHVVGNGKPAPPDPDEEPDSP